MIIEARKIYYCFGRDRTKNIKKLLEKDKNIFYFSIKNVGYEYPGIYKIYIKFNTNDDKLKTDKLLRTKYRFEKFGNYDLIKKRYKNKKG